MTTRRTKQPSALDRRLTAAIDEERHRYGGPTHDKPLSPGNSLHPGRIRFLPTNGDPGCEGWMTTYPQPTSDQFGGWVPLARDARSAVVEYQGAPGPIGLSIDVLFDDWVDARSINAYWDAFMRMCSRHDGHAPAHLDVVWVGQSAPEAARKWVVGAMSPTAEVLIADDARGTLLRRGASVTILDATQGELVRGPVKAAQHAARKAAKSPNKRRRTIVSKKGDTLHAIAVRYLHDQMRWTELDVLPLGTGTRDATQVLPPNSRVQLP